MDNERLARLEEMVARILHIIEPLDRMGGDAVAQLGSVVEAYRQGRADVEHKARFWKRIALGVAMLQGGADVAGVLFAINGFLHGAPR